MKQEKAGEDKVAKESKETLFLIQIVVGVDLML